MTPRELTPAQRAALERGRQRAARAGQLSAEQQAAIQQGEQRALAARTGIVITRFNRTIRYSHPLFTQDALNSIVPPQGSQRFQLVIRDPGYNKSGFRSTGWIVVEDFDPSSIADSFGVSLDKVASVVFDTGQ